MAKTMSHLAASSSSSASTCSGFMMPPVCRMAVNAVVDEGAVRDVVNGVHCDRGVDPQKRLFKAVLFHDLPHIAAIRF